MKHLQEDNSFIGRLKGKFGNFQFVINTAIDDEDVKQFILYGFKYILKQQKTTIIVNLIGLAMLILGIFPFLGLCVFLGTMCYVAIRMLNFVSGSDEHIFEEVKVELDQEAAIPQKSLTEYVTARINQKKYDRRKFQ